MIATTNKSQVRTLRLTRKRRAGTIIPIVAIALLTLLGSAALTIDIGSFFMTRSHLQGVCDAAALAGSSALPSVAAAQDKAAAYYAVNVTHSDDAPSGNSGTYNINGDTVVITTPYSDEYTTSKGWDPDDLLQVQTTTTVPLTFASALGMPSRTMVVSAVALRTGGAGNGWGLGEGALFALDQGFALSCNTFKVTGTVAANSDINMSLNIVDIGNVLHAKWRNKISANQIRGGFRLEYGTTYDISCNHADIASIVKTPQTDLVPPITYDPAEWASDFDVDQTYASLTINRNNYQHPAGTTRVEGNLTINANNTDLRDCTFIVGGHVTINTNNLYLGYHEKYMCFYLTGAGSTININMNNISVQGDIYAPLGYINCSSNNVHRGWWVARRISISCNNFQLDGIPARASSGSALMLVE
ncbi:MAG: pilus assembly protein TadG-related protein [Armatimonadia bacterium]